MFVTYLLRRLKEHSTWYGIVLIATSFGLDLSGPQQQAIMYFGLAMSAAPDVNLVKALKKQPTQ